MTMYLPNPDQRPVGDEVAEFLDVPPIAETPIAADEDDDGGSLPLPFGGASGEPGSPPTPDA
jgi:hypothetical protein